MDLEGEVKIIYLKCLWKNISFVYIFYYLIKVVEIVVWWKILNYKRLKKCTWDVKGVINKDSVKNVFLGF